MPIYRLSYLSLLLSLCTTHAWAQTVPGAVLNNEAQQSSAISEAEAFIKNRPDKLETEQIAPTTTDESVPLPEAVVEPTPQPRTEVIFFDDFSENMLAEYWQVSRPNSLRYRIQDSQFIIETQASGTLDDKNIENLLRFNESLPRGDWIITVQYQIDYYSHHEQFLLGIYDDMRHYTVATVTATENLTQYHRGLALSVVQKDNKSVFVEAIDFLSSGITAPFSTLAQGLFWFNEQMPQPQILRLQKKDELFYISATASSDASDPQAEWATLPELTLEQNGHLIMGFTLTEAANQASRVAIDWIKIEIILDE